MKRIAAMTKVRADGAYDVVIHGEGEIDPLILDQVSRECKRFNAACQERLAVQDGRLTALTEQLKQVTERRDRLLTADIKRREAATRRARIRQALEDVRDNVAIAICLPLLLAERIGLIEPVDDVDEANRRAYLELTRAREAYLAQRGGAGKL